ncbi:MAG: pyruvate kinase [Gammaproteobacteria bacterium]|nr:pyruvate kinase [Gammaproteobacteria bacterium]MDH3535333.1 pyruvate kinase [Gammaproteobacteria bacterium]
MRAVPRRTKIVATLGPATESDEAVDSLIKAGVDVVRLNFSHGVPEEHKARAEKIRRIGLENNRHLAILADLQGPKIRLEKFRDGMIELAVGDRFCLDTECPDGTGDGTRVGITYKKLPQDVQPDNILMLDDGRIVLRVDSVDGARINCTVEVGGELSDNKGINLKGGGLTAEVLTEKDKADLKTAALIDADYVAVSFPRNAADMLQARRLLDAEGCAAGLVAKIERAEALDNLEEIIAVSEAIMIARGDLGVEIGDAKLPAVQKEIIRSARDLNCVVITATQMMESMRDNPIPTRAEVFDVANAVLDGTDAVMLSAETATGRYPSLTVLAMSDICLNAEQHSRAIKSRHRLDDTFERVDEAIAMATMYTANHLDVRAIASLTESGSTALWMSRISSGIPIYALSRHQSTNRKVNLYRGVFPVYFPTIHTNHAEANREAVDLMKKRGTIADGDLVIITKGDLMGTGGGTNAMKIVEVGNMPDFIA